MQELLLFITENYLLIIEKGMEHIELAGVAVLMSTLVGVPVGFAIANNEKAANVVVGIANIIQTVPSLALFAFMLPLFGIGRTPAIVALFLYGLLPIIKNTLIGIRNVTPSIIEAARGMGMSTFQILYKVQIPMAMSVIMGGVRIATVTSIGIATIAVLIGAGGLGQLIYRGLSMTNTPMILSGAIFSALLAILADFILGIFENKLTSKGLR
jgi:osmoprotectant transport system permease protein